MPGRVVSAFATVVLSAAACAPPVSVTTQQNPVEPIAGFRTFRVLAPPARRPDAPQLAQSDPMLDNSITNQALRTDLQQALEARGYRPVGRRPDFLVAYYAGTKEKFDTTYWAAGPYRYGYWGARNRWAWPWYGDAGPVAYQVDESTQGTLIVDLIDPKTQQLAWRGQAVATVSTDPAVYAKELQRAVGDIVRKLPAVSSPVTASGAR